jgi:hypothetical protein
MGNTFGRKSLKADVAQLVEQPIRNRQVSGSSPLVGSILSGTYDQFTATSRTTAARRIRGPQHPRGFWSHL